MHNKTYILFTRYPRVGKAKTRLISTLGAFGAARLQKEMSEHIFAIALGMISQDNRLSVFYSSATKRQMRWWLGTYDGVTYHRQSGGDIGKKMQNAFAAAFDDGNDRCILFGADCPDITQKDLTDAMEALMHKDVVIGPAKDGGYYLIGLRRDTFVTLQNTLFSDIAWSTNTVFDSTVKVIEETDMSIKELPLYSDIDEVKDLSVWKSIPKINTIKLSVIIPTYNEAREIGETIENVMMGDNVECIVIDGGSTDQTMDIAKKCGARVYHVAGGRCAQLNFGAEKALGEIFLFLHADTHVLLGYDDMIRKSFENDKLDCSAFTLCIRGGRIAFRIVEFFTNIRSRLFHLPYGDQGICVGKEVFQDLGGFPKEVIMEDYIFMRTIHKRKMNYKTLSMDVQTSSRRWEHLGVLRTTLINQVIVAGYYLGVPLEKLAQWYRKKW